jgi:FKBP-type peptidyl-prolyl cis-trans isomerase FklB
MSMKQNALRMLALALVAGAISATAQTGEPTDYSKIFKNDREKLSYAIGMYFGNNIKGLLEQETNSVDVNVIAKAFADTASGKPTLITQEQETEIMTAFKRQINSELMAKRMAEAKAMSETNSKAGAEFMAKNKKMPGVIVLPPDPRFQNAEMQYKILTAGTGALPTTNDTVTVNYSGKTLDGKEFDSSTKSSMHDFAVTRVIPGWTKALQMMPVGSKWQLFIPAPLAYGDRGAPPSIMPGDTLIFEVELLGVKPTAAAGQSSAQMTSDIIKVPSAEGLKRGEKIETIKASDVGKMTNAPSN